VQRSDARVRRATPTPVDECVDRGRITLEHRLDPPVREIAHAAGEPGVAGAARARHAIADALHPARDDDAFAYQGPDARGRACRYPAARWIAARIRT